MNKKKAAIILFLSIFWSMFLLMGCNSATVEPEPTAVPEQESQTIGLLIPNTISFFTTLQQGAEEAAGRLEVTLEVREADDDIDAQKSQVQELIDLGIDALIIIPVDNEALVADVEAADAAGIAVFTVDRSIDADVVVAHIASDNVAGGRMAADFLVETINEAGSVVELTGIAGTSAAQDRGQGFNEIVAEYPDIEIVAQETGNFNQEDGKAAFAAILESQTDIDAVFAHNDDMILGAIAAAQEAGVADDIVFVGFDAIEAAVAALEEGQLRATIAQQPAEMGRLGVETAVQYLDGQTVPGYIPVELALITN